MAIKERMSGNEAVSYAIRQVNPDVMPAFPITPSTEIPQMVSTYISNGEMDTEFIPVESEHSSMSAAIGAEAAGARSLTATSSAGLALMWEELLLAASNRLPLVLTLVNRTLSGPININCDHSDGMGARDTGWIQIYAENNQEAYDNFIQAYPIAEDTRVHLPVMICQDGFITSHAVENIELLEDKLVKDFVGEYEPEEYLLNPGKPIAVGPYSVSNYAMEAKKNQEIALENSKEVILEVAKKFAKISGREYGLFEEYKTEDADYIMLIMGSAAGTAKDPIILEEGLKYSPIQLSPEDAQFVATKLQSIDQVASAFRVPPHKVGDLTRGTYSNNEQGNIEFYIDCIRPKIEQLEEELNRKLFLESEKAEYYIDIDFRGLFRADTATRKDWYREMFYIGVFSSNDIRALEDLPAYEGGFVV